MERPGTRGDLDIIQKFSPSIYFHPKETCFPISIETYLSVCCVRSKKDPYFCIQNPTCAKLYELYTKGKSDLYLQFNNSNWEERTRGDRKECICYCRDIKISEDSHLLIYFYLFSHTEPYNCCGCGPPFVSFAHRADLKFIAVETKGDDINRVYYGAHGQKAGEWRNKSQIRTDGTHPIAYSCKNDHSMYPDMGSHPRIYFLVYDECDAVSSTDITRPETIQVYGKGPKFRPDTMGWIYFPGNMNEDGIASPACQNFWTGNIPEKSNNWFLRLFCCNYF